MLRLLASLAVLLCPYEAIAARACATRDAISGQLQSKYAELPIGRGLAAGGHLMQVFADKGDGSWTVVLTRPDGMSCIVAAGKHWQDIAAPIDGPEA